MIDYYGNGKFQLLFSGKNWLHLLDRNGNYVERFPVRLRSPASGPPALFDYDGTRDYRIVVPGEDRYIYAYDKSGNVVKGWKPFRTNGVVKTAVRFFRVSGKDYLVAADNVTLYFLDRTGNIRLGLKEPVVMAHGSEIRLFTGQQPALVLSSPDGVVQIIAFDGKVTKTSLGKFGIDHTFDFFDIDGDGFGEYVFIDKGILYLYDNDKSEVFQRDFGSVYTEGPINFVFSSSDRKIGLFDNSKKLIYLVDQKGNTMKGFPLRGASAFSIGNLSDRNEFHLIVGGDDNFLYNYKLESGYR
jgi:WD40 repeat protein